MSRKSIFIVRGSTGEYDDWSVWSVGAYPNKKLAQKHADLATDRAKEIESICVKRGILFHDCNLRNQWDSDMDIDYTGTTYDVYGIDIYDIETEKDFEKYWFTELL